MTDLVATPTQAIVERNAENESLIREQFGLQEANSTELEYFFAVCNRLQLDPFQRQIYAIMRFDKRIGRKKLTVQVGIDGYRAVAHRTNQCGGCDDAVFSGDNGKGGPAQATVTVYRIVQGVRCPFTATARWDEYGSTDAMWVNKPHGQLAKCAEALAWRKGFSSELAGTYTDVEMAQADNALEEVAGLTEDQAANLMELSERAGIAEAVAVVRVQNMKPSEYPRAVETLEQRIVEQGVVVVDAEVVA